MENNVTYVVSTAWVTIRENLEMIDSQKALEDTVDYCIFQDRGFPGYTDQESFKSLDDAISFADGLTSVVQTADVIGPRLDVIVADISKISIDEDGDEEMSIVKSIYPKLPA